MTHKNLILEAFKKATIYLAENGIPSPSKSGVAEVLSDYIELECNFQFGERRLRDYYNEALKDEVLEIKQQAVRDGLAKYLGYEDFRDLLIRTTESKKDLQTENLAETTDNGKAYFVSQFLRGNRTTVLIIVGCLIAFLIINAVNKEKWMVWEGSQFVETEFDAYKMENGQIFLFNDSQVARFKKVQPNCDTQFFNSEGNALLWYGKNRKGDLEYFTDLGKHPETGKTLKPITRYMIKKYICERS